MFLRVLLGDWVMGERILLESSRERIPERDELTAYSGGEVEERLDLFR
jgi:hypothetical protein